MSRLQITRPLHRKYAALYIRWIRRGMVRWDDDIRYVSEYWKRGIRGMVLHAYPSLHEKVKYQ